MKKRIMLICLLLLSGLVLASCSSSSVDTDENAALVLGSELARFLDMEARENQAAIPEEPWIILRKNSKEEWRVIGCSLENLTPETLSRIRTVVRCDNLYIYEQYRLSGSPAGSGSSEYVHLYFFDVPSGGCRGMVCIEPAALPRSASSVPHYEMNDGTVLRTIENRFRLGIAAADMPEDMQISGTTLVKYENKRFSKDVSEFYRAPKDRYEKPFCVPRSITEIGQSAFRKTSFPQYILGENVTLIDKYAFENCKNMTGVDLPHVREVGNYAFHGCEKLEKVSTGDSLTAVGYGAFQNCTALREIDLSHVQELGDLSFSGCTSLEKVLLSDSNRIIENIHGVFFNCPALREVTVPQDNPAIMSRNGVVYSKDGHTLLLFPASAETTIPEALEGVDTLGREVFESMQVNLELTEGKLVLDSLKAIGINAFNHTEGIRELVLGGEVSKIERAFKKCTDLERAVITAPLKTLGESCFNGCDNLREIILPGTLEKIDFCLAHCPLLKEIRIPPSVTEIAPDMFAAPSAGILLIVTLGSYAEQYAVENNLEYRPE